MRLISLFSGTGAFELGFERSGFRVVGQCEFDPHAQAVLKRHWPDVPLHGDISTLEGDAFGPAEAVVWGSPCQGLSLAGRRAGLKDKRSGLFIEGIRFIRELREATNGEYPRFSVWENVPGALSSNGGRDFRAVLEAFIEAEVPMSRPGKWANAGVVRGNGREVAWRVLDSQHFGVAQRRRRVFVVADFGGHGAAEVLFEREGVPGHPAKGRTAQESAARGAESRAGDGGVAGTLESRERGGGFPTDPIAPTPIAPADAHPTLNAAHGGKDAGPAGLVPVAFAITDYSTGNFAETGVSGPLTGTPDRSRTATLVNPVTYGVRRLTPRECERLQGLPDDHTRYRPDGSEIADTHRYRLIGNAVTVNVAEWLGHRVAAALAADELEEAA